MPWRVMNDEMAAKIKNHYLPEVSAFLLGRSKPSMVTVNLTSRCNQQCVYCEIGKHIPSERRDNLTIDDLMWIIDEMYSNKIHRLALCGGEPFMFDGIIDIVEYARNKRIICAITTNGMTIQNLTRTELLALKTANAEINISIDSFDEKIQSRTRGIAGSLEKTLESIRILLQHEIPLIILTVISRYNYRNLYQHLIYAYDLGIRQVLFQPVIHSSNYPDRPAIPSKAELNLNSGDFDILNSELRKAQRFERKHHINTNVYRILPWIKYYLQSAETKNGHMFFDNVLKKFYCRDIDAIIDITYDGGIQPCGLELAKTTIHQNRELGLIGQWKNATGALRNKINNREYPEICNACCHHFSRNMLASVMRYPIQNRAMLLKMTYLILSRIMFRTYKKVMITS